MPSGLDGLPLAAGVGAFGLEHLEPAVAFAVILPLQSFLADCNCLGLAAIDAKARPLKVSALAAAMSVAPK